MARVQEGETPAEGHRPTSASLPPDSGILQRWRGGVDIRHGEIVTCSMNSDYHMATKKS
jgi:hypothetical protein